MNFGAVCTCAGEEDWEPRCKALDKEAAGEIRSSVIALLNTIGNEELFGFFKQFSENKSVGDLAIGTLISILTRSVHKARGRLLVLVDEYDQPVREGLPSLIPQHGAGLYANVKNNIGRGCYPSYFGFFRAIKAALDHGGIPLKIWLTGILPIRIKETSGLNVVRVTFGDDMANAVGLADSDVQRMLDRVHEKIPFRDGEREQATRMHFNYLGFPGGETALTTPRSSME